MAYDTDENGRITTPGQFEGEMIYLPHFWEYYLNGFEDDDDGEVLSFNVTDEDRRDFPGLLNDKSTVRLYQRDDGFVCEV